MSDKRSPFNSYAKFNTPQDLGQLTDAELKNAGVEAKDERKIVLTVVKKAGFKTLASLNSETSSTVAVSSEASGSLSSGFRPSKGVASVSSFWNLGHSRIATPITIHISHSQKTNTPKKRKRDHDLEVPSPDSEHAREELEGAELGSFEFGEVLDEEVRFTYLRILFVTNFD